VRRGASAAEIKRAYRRLAKKLHPDLAGELGAARMAEVNAAYDVLLAAAGDDAAETEPAEHVDVPDGFVLFPAPRLYRFAPHGLFRHADLREGALSLSATSGDLSGLDRLPPSAVWRLDLSDKPVDDQEVARVWRIERLEQLDLSNTEVTDRGLVGISALRQLDTLQLAGCRIGDLGLAEVAELPALAVLGLAGTWVTSEGLVRLAGHPALMTLDLRGVAVRSGDVAALASIPKLKSLRVSVRAGWRLRALRRRRPDIAFL
jgi:hypothetical protein